MIDLINDQKEDLLTLINGNRASTIEKISALSSLHVDRMYILAERIAILEVGSKEKRQRDAAIGLHRPDPESTALDALLNPLIDETQTNAEREILKAALIKHIESLAQDRGQRSLLQAMNDIDAPSADMPTEPPGKAPDQTFQERRDTEMKDLKEKADIVENAP